MTNKQILVAEDNPTNRELIRELLQIHGYGILEAADGQQALDLAKTQNPSLALIDIQMPKLNGLQLVRLIRQDAILCTMPTIALTAYAMRGDREKALQEGFDGYVTKPIRLPVLMTEIEKCYASREGKSVSREIA
jgi:two-component system cell cycle response regulator DivK